mmetsp:Transcript_4194/g.7149  ORF Transcript_4194/g.7149 Transcript_4194/m.7149 type:complete len:195 (+) Transcript_4194:1116-1700(+)
MSAVRKFTAKQLRELRNKSKKDLLKQVDELKKELHQLRVAQVTGAAQAKISNIYSTRKNIARIYTIISQITKQKVRDECVRQNKKLLPLDLRPKLSRKDRLRLPKELRFKKTPKQRRLIQKYPRRKFAVIDSSRPLPDNVRDANIESVLSAKKESSRFQQYLRRKKQAKMSMNALRRLKAKEAPKQEEQKQEAQ